MPLQLTEEVSIGQIKVSDNPALMLTIKNISSAIAVVIYDKKQHVGGIAHVLLPDSQLAEMGIQHALGTFANLAIPALVEAYLETGGSKEHLTVRLAGGSQLFNFGAGGTNAMNSGTRNAVAIRAAFSKLGILINNTDIGGNKGRELKFQLATGVITISVSRKPDYTV